MANPTLLLCFIVFVSIFTSGDCWRSVSLPPPTIPTTGSTTVSSSSDEGGSMQHGSHKVLNSSDFTQLNLEVSDLLGSRWFENNNKISVYHSIEIVDAVLVDNNQLSLRLEFYLHQRWTLTGVKLPAGLFKEGDPSNLFITSKESVLQHMWRPDSYISTSREKSFALKSIVYIYQDLTIVLRLKMFAIVACSTNFYWYPVDKQACLLAVEGYTYHDDFVRYLWENETKDDKAVTVKIERPLQYDLHGITYMNGSIKRGEADVKFPYVLVQFVFERKLGNSVIQIYVPTSLVVILTWFNFWLGLDAIPARMSLLVTSMLTLVTMHVGAKKTIPPVHYITMMDLWILGCMTFVFCAVCEFVTVKYLHWRLHKVPENKHKKAQEDEEKKINEWAKVLKASMGPSTVPEVWEEEEKQQQLQSRRRGAIPAKTTSEKSIVPTSSSPSQADGDGLKSDVSLSVSTGLLEGIGLDNERMRRQYRNQREEKVRACRCQCLAGHELWVRIDMCARVAFPVMFCVFNCAYWPVIFQACKQEANMTL